MVYAPVGLPSVAGWQLSDWISVRRTSTAAAGGLITLELDQLDPDVFWLVDHGVCQCSSTTATKMRMYENAVSSAAFLSGSNSGNFDEADYPQGLRIAPSTRLVVQWTGASDGSTAGIALQARLFRRVAG